MGGHVCPPSHGMTRFPHLLYRMVVTCCMLNCWIVELLNCCLYCVCWSTLGLFTWWPILLNGWWWFLLAMILTAFVEVRMLGAPQNVAIVVHLFWSICSVYHRLISSEVGSVCHQFSAHMCWRICWCIATLTVLSIAIKVVLCPQFTSAVPVLQQVLQAGLFQTARLCLLVLVVHWSNMIVILKHSVQIRTSKRIHALY